MLTISYTKMQNNIEAILKRLDDDRIAITVTRKGKSFIIMSADDYTSLEETLHLLRPPNNANLLKRAEDDFQEGKNYHAHNLIEE
ncbi:MAG: type II toxin-antitoxin system Phd/YefM family antitoxin [bacterium]